VRRGAAEHALGRYAAALETYAAGLLLDPTDKALEAGRLAAKEGEAKAAKARVDQAKREEVAAARAEKARLEAAEEAAEGMLDGFFTEVASEEEKRHDEQRAAEAAARAARLQTEKTDKYTGASLGSSEEQVGRLTGPNFKFKNLNPFHVLQLDVDATVEDVKFRYKKLSLLVHPDKNLGLDKASEAFDEVKRAYEDLLEEEKRELTIATIEGTRAVCGKAHRRLLAKGATEDTMDSLDAKMDKAVLKAFADIELRRRDTEKHLLASKKRERDQEEEVKAAAAAAEAHDAKWATGTRVEDRIGDWRSFQGDGPQVKNVKNYKQQVRRVFAPLSSRSGGFCVSSPVCRTCAWAPLVRVAQERGDSKKPKFGAVDMEGWRKDWK
jgi:DnaJ family protein C protein 8